MDTPAAADEALPQPVQQCAERARGRPTIGPRLNRDVADVTVSVHDPPQTLPPALDGAHSCLVEAPANASDQEGRIQAIGCDESAESRPPGSAGDALER